MVVEAMRPSDVLYDIGASIGMVAIHAASRGGIVYAFEPDPHYSKRLSNNVELNELRNVRVVSCAIGSEQGASDLYTNGDGGSSPCLRPIGRKTITKVNVETLDGMLERHSLPAPTLIKIDIEGAEYLALQGMAALLNSRSAPRAIFMEIHPNLLKLFGASAEKVFDFLDGTGYRCVYQCRRHDQIHAVFWRLMRRGKDACHEAWLLEKEPAWSERVLADLWTHALYLQMSPDAARELQRRFDGRTEDSLCALLTISARGKGRPLLAIGRFDSLRKSEWSKLAGREAYSVPTLSHLSDLLRSQEADTRFRRPHERDCEDGLLRSKAFAVIFLNAKIVSEDTRIWSVLPQLVDRMTEKAMLVITDYSIGENAELDAALISVSQEQGPLKPVGSSWRISAFRCMKSPEECPVFADPIVVSLGKGG
jgi:FkbM family methyltransferase